MLVLLGFVNESELQVDLNYGEWRAMYTSGTYRDKPILWIQLRKSDGSLGPKIPFEPPRRD